MQSVMERKKCSVRKFFYLYPINLQKMEDMRMQFVDLLSSTKFVDFQFFYFQV